MKNPFLTVTDLKIPKLTYRFEYLTLKPNIMNVKERIDAFDAIEIAAKFCGIENDNYDDDDVETALADGYNIGIDEFTKIVQWCYDRIGIDVSPLTKTTYLGFADKGIWLTKKDVSGPVINFIINWILEGEKYKDEGNGFEKVITKGGKPEFKIVITRAENEVKITKPSK